MQRTRLGLELVRRSVSQMLCKFLGLAVSVEAELRKRVNQNSVSVETVTSKKSIPLYFYELKSKNECRPFDS